MNKQTVLVPGSVLKESFLDKYHISVNKLSEDIGLSPSAIRQIINNKLRIGIVVALKLSVYFDKPVKYWLDLQNQYELSELEKDKDLVEALKQIPKAQKAAPKAAAKQPDAKKEQAGRAAAKKVPAKAAKTRAKPAKDPDVKKPGVRGRGKAQKTS